MKYDCELICDVLPLYQEGLASEATKKAVEEHLAECAACRAEAAKLKREAPDVRHAALPVKRILRGIKTRRVLSVLLAVFLLLSFAFAVGSRLTDVKYLPYKKGDLLVTRSDNQLIVSIRRPDMLVSMKGESDPDHPHVYRIELETYQARVPEQNGAGIIPFEQRPDSASGKELEDRSYPNQMVLDVDNDREVSVYLANPGQNAVLLFGKDLYQDGGYMTLPQLSLAYYELAAAGLAAVLAVALFFLYKKERAKTVLIYLLGLPIAYLLGHVMVKGFVTLSYSGIIRDLGWILACALCLYGAFVIYLRLRAMRKKGEPHAV